MRTPTLAALALCLLPHAPRAEVMQFNILDRTPAFAGRSFGKVRPYDGVSDLP